MASRTLEVRLRAAVQGYTASMAQAAASTGSLEASLLGVQRAGAGVAQVGDRLTKRVSLPIALVGAAATKMAIDFDQSFAQMRGLAGVAADEVDGLKESVLDLAGETGRAPQELAEALYFVRSSGIDGKRALEALEASAKGAASGLGSTEVVADAVTSAMNAYATSGMTAARATDVLVATAREGKAEPAELAAQMGRLLPVAAQLGISFEDVGAAVATLSLSGNDAATSATQLSNVMSKLLKPSQQGAEALAAVGLSADSVKQMIAERGLLGTLEELRARLGESGFVKFLEDQQAVQGGLALLGGDLEATRERFDRLGDSAGASADAFDKTDSDARRLQQAWAEIQATLIQVGGAIAPVVAALADLAAAGADAFESLPEPLRDALVAMAGLLAATFPLLSLYGRLKAAAAGFALASGLSATSLARLSTVARGAVLALGSVGAALATIEILTSQRESRAEGWLKDRIGDVDVTTLQGVRDAIKATKAELDELDDREGKGRIFSIGPANIFATGGDADRQERIDQARESLKELEAQEEALIGQEAQTAAAFVGTDQALADLNDETVNHINTLSDFADQLRATFDPLFGFADALAANQEAQRAVIDAQAAYNDAVAQYGPTSAEALAAEQALAEAHRDAARSALDVTAAEGALKAGIEAGTISVAQAKDQLATWVGQGRISQETADRLAGEFDMLAASVTAVPDAKHIAITATDQASGVVRVLQERVDALTGKTIFLNAVASYPVPGYQTFGGRQAGGGVAPRYYGSGGINWKPGMGPSGTDVIPAWLTPGEMVLNAAQQANLFRLLSAGPMTAMAAGGRGGGRVVNYNVSIGGGVVDKSGVGREVVDAIKAYERSNGAGWRN